MEKSDQETELLSPVSVSYTFKLRHAHILRELKLEKVRGKKT